MDEISNAEQTHRRWDATTVALLDAISICADSAHITGAATDLATRAKAAADLAAALADVRRAMFLGHG